MSTFELILFDLDGTLIDSKDDLADSVNMTLEELKLKTLSNEVIYSYVGSGVRALLSDSVGSNTSEEYRKSLKIFKKYYMENLLNHTCLYEGAAELIKDINTNKNIKQAIVTNKPDIYTKPIIAGLNLEKAFDLIIGSSKGIPLKPNPYMLNFAVKKFATSPEKVLMVGDGTNDLLAAKAANVQVCAVGYGLGNKDDLIENKPDFFIESIDELRKII